MKRLVFMAPRLEQAQAVVDDLKTLDVDDEHIYVVAKDHHMLEEAHLHEATDLETTEAEKDRDWGAVAGGAVGVVAGLSAVTLAPVGLVVAGGAAVLSGLVGAGLGGWLGWLIGEETPLHTVEKYQHAIEAGHLLVMVDIDDDRRQQAHDIIRKHCNQALVEEVRPTHRPHSAA